MYSIKVLTAIGIEKGNSGGGFQYYQIIGEDEAGQQYLATFGVKLHHTESVEKTFGRMLPVQAPKADAVPDPLAPDTPTEIAPQPVPTEKKELTEYEKLLLED